MRALFFVFEAESVGGAADGETHLDFLLVEPALVGWLAVDVGRTAHGFVELKLRHEAWVRLGVGTGFADEGEGGDDVRAGLWAGGEEVCEDYGD